MRQSIGWLLVAALAACDARTAKITTPAAAPAVLRNAERAQPATVQHRGAQWLTSEIDLATTELELVGQRPGEPATLLELQPFLEKRHRVLVSATNAGIFDVDRRPMGLHVQGGELLSALSTSSGAGNFFLKPNGVFWIDNAGAHVAATEHYEPQGQVRLATQSGPLLLDHGQIHPAFKETGGSLRVRNGVGVDGRGHVWLVLSLQAVSFHDMATLLRDVLGCSNALYLDGEISAMAAPGLAPFEPHEYAGLLVATKRLAQAGTAPTAK